MEIGTIVAIVAGTLALLTFFGASISNVLYSRPRIEAVEARATALEASSAVKDAQIEKQAHQIELLISLNGRQPQFDEIVANLSSVLREITAQGRDHHEEHLQMVGVLERITEKLAHA